jgi:hypothetical protein
LDRDVEVDVTTRPDALTLHAARRPAATVGTLVAVCMLIVGGATAVAVGLSKGSAGQHRRFAGADLRASAPAPCPPSGARVEPSRPTAVGRWPYKLLEKGTFGSVVSGAPGTAFAIEACGAVQSDLRVVRMSLERPESVQAASPLVRAALLPSSLVSSGGSLYLGAARLDLGGPKSSPPYELTVYRLDPATLTFTASRRLGRGYGLALSATGSEIVAATGSSLIRVGPSALAPRRLAGFGRSVAQHVAADGVTGDYAVGLLTPGVAGPGADARIELVAGRTGHVISRVMLPAGSDPESLAVGDGRLWAAVGDGLSTTVHTYSLPALSPMGSGQPKTEWRPLTAAESIGLDFTAGSIWVRGLSLLECSSAANGRPLATTDQTGPAPVSLSQIFESGPALYAVSPAGIGRLFPPASCTR